MTFGPYETEQAAATEPLARAVRELHDRIGHHNIGRDVRDLELSFLRQACDDAGVQLGRYDERILTWLCNYEPATVQVLIGLISRAHAAGLAQASGAAPRLERVKTDNGFYRVLRPGVGAGALTYDAFGENMSADWLPAQDPRVGTSAVWIAAGILDQHGEEALWRHLETLAQQLSKEGR